MKFQVFLGCILATGMNLVGCGQSNSGSSSTQADQGTMRPDRGVDLNDMAMTDAAGGTGGAGAAGGTGGAGAAGGAGGAGATGGTGGAGDLCGNGTVDDGETCDGDCPEMCPPAEAMCTQTRLMGTAAACDAQCVTEPISACTGDDGCCPDGCTSETDSDCLASTGAACAEDTECQPGQMDAGRCISNSWPGGYCSTICVTDADCPGGGVCGGRYCLAACEDNDGCREGYACAQFMGSDETVCAPAIADTALPGQACAEDSACFGTPYSNRCIQADTGYPGGYCTAECFLDADCPGGSQCAWFDDDTSQCLASCEGQMDCREGYECWDGRLDDGRNFCLPVASGDAALGEACDIRVDCAGGQAGFCASADAGGYCSQMCTAESPCPEGAHCSFVDLDTSEGICLLDCGAEDVCGPRHSCTDLDNDGTNECWLGGNAEGAIGQACADVTQCPGAENARCLYSDYSTGYCSQTCTWQTPCPAGSHCAYRNEYETGVCMDDCLPNTPGECRDGFLCGDGDYDGVTECIIGAVGPGLVGAACENTPDCSNGIQGYCINNGSWAGGYCSRSCQAGVPCPPGSHCGLISDETNRGSCVADCETDADCRPGYGCYDFDRDGMNVRECGPRGARGGRVGDRCGDLVDCAGNYAQCLNNSVWIRGYCSVRNCTAQGGCPDGSHCSYINATTREGVCLQSCEDDSQCSRPGYACVDSDGSGNTECGPVGAGEVTVGGPCEYRADCAGGARAVCADVWPRGSCLLTCSANEVCPAGSHCSLFNQQRQSGYCLSDCATSEDCRPGYACVDADQNASTECVPAAAGGGDVGAPCQQTADCGGGDDGLCISSTANPTWVNGYCTVRNCEQAGNQCPEGSICTILGQMGEGYCMQRCDVAADCTREGYTCRDGDRNGDSECIPVP